MYKILGVANIVLIVAVTSQYWTRKLNQCFFHRKSAGAAKLRKVLHTCHKPTAVLLLISIFVHGWLAMGALTLHTGTVAAVSFLLTALLGLLFWRLHKKEMLQWHRALALVSILLVVVHLLFPWLL